MISQKVELANDRVNNFVKIPIRECRQKLGLNRKDKYAQNRRN